MPPPTYTGRPILNEAAVKRTSTTTLAQGILARTTTSDVSEDQEDGSDKLINILLLVLGLVFLALLAVSLLFLFRRYRNRQRMHKENLPSYTEAGYGSGSLNHHGLTIETKHHGRSSTIYISRDGAPMLANPHSPPHSPDNVPQIHITFPDEQDSEGKRKSGRVLVVRVGDNATVGLEPMQEEELPAYEKESKNGFSTLDMDQIGGLKEKDHDLFK